MAFFFEAKAAIFDFDFLNCLFLSISNKALAGFEILFGGIESPNRKFFGIGLGRKTHKNVFNPIEGLIEDVRGRGINGDFVHGCCG